MRNKKNPLETIESDKMLTSIYEGLISTFPYPESVIGIIVYHTRDYDLAYNTIEHCEIYKSDVEEALFFVMPRTLFYENCLNSEYLDCNRCKELLNGEDEAR